MAIHIRYSTLNNLSSALRSRFTQTWKNEDIEEAIRLCQESLESLPSLHPDRYFSYRWLQEAYLSRYQVQLKSADLSLAVENFRLASRHPTQGFPARIKEAIDWARKTEVYQHDSTLEAYQMCLELFDNHVMTRSTIISRREAATAFRDAQSLPVDAASCAIRRDDLRRAVRLVEQGRWTAMYRRLQEQWGAVVAEIRNLKGFSRFLLPPSYEDLQAAARYWPSHHPRSQVNTRAVPFVVPTSGEPRHCSIPAHHSHTSGEAQEGDEEGIASPLADSSGTDIMLPIVIRPPARSQSNERLSNLAVSNCNLHFHSPPRMLTPFERRQTDGSELCLEDVYICSYTPTLSALIRSRTDDEETCELRHSLQSDKVHRVRGKARRLLTVDSELELVRKLVPATANPTTLSGDDATRADKPLTLLDIMEKDIPHAEFAFLSACHTAVGDEETPDEVIHLAAGLQFSGFKSVIGTLWVVDDAVAKHVVEAFYKKMVKGLEDGDMMDCTKAAWALNRATNAVKTKVPLEQRMVFIHIVQFFRHPTYGRCEHHLKVVVGWGEKYNPSALPQPHKYPEMFTWPVLPYGLTGRVSAGILRGVSCALQVGSRH
ncbi:CHAT domain-containing protein [Suillus subluteus]|nr:CHAT domain-containing protein [Suillus subluteus]